MKKLFSLPKLPFLLLIFTLWRIVLHFLSLLGSYFVEKNEVYVGPTVWANFDGIHYLSIASVGYQQFEQAFFPVYPMLIHYIGQWAFQGSYVNAGLFISNISFLLSLIVLWELFESVRIRKKRITDDVIRWMIVFIVFFPTSFYFASIYTESFFMLLVVTSFYLLYHKKIIWYGIIAGLASGVRVIGSFLLVPAGLLLYMWYLGKEHGDPLMFVHSQPAFGAGRSGGDLIFLPQVYYRYIIMFLRVIWGQDSFSYSHGIAILELVSFHGVLFLIWKAWRQGLPREWVYFSLAAVIFPTLSGTLSSIPRYVLVAFPIYFALASFSGKMRTMLLVVSVLLFSILTMLFTQGNWVS